VAEADAPEVATLQQKDDLRLCQSLSVDSNVKQNIATTAKVVHKLSASSIYSTTDHGGILCLRSIRD
jgi:hypothetical protein